MEMVISIYVITVTNSNIYLEYVADSIEENCIVEYGGQIT